MKYIFVLIVMTTSFLHACLWLSGTTLDGEYREFNAEQPSFWFSKNIESDKEIVISKRLASIVHKTKADKAVMYISKGENKKAIDMLLNISNNSIDIYTKASNLAVAYELDGDIVSAKKWMKKALSVNKKSHYGTEWLHLFILKSTYHLKINPQWLKNRRLIPLPREFNETTRINIDGSEYTILELRAALIYQLRERVLFVKPKDKIVSELFYTLGRLEAETRVVDEAIQIFNFAKLYGFSDSSLIENQIKECNKAFIYFYIRYGLWIVFTIFLVWYLQKYFKSKVPKNSENQIILNTFYSTVIIISIVLAFSILGIFLYAVLLNFGHIMNEPPPMYIGAILGYYFGLFQISRYMKQKNYVVKNRFKTIFWSAIILICIYLYLIFLLYQTWMLQIVILYFLLLGLYLVLKKKLPLNIE